MSVEVNWLKHLSVWSVNGELKLKKTLCRSDRMCSSVIGCFFLCPQASQIFWTELSPEFIQTW